MRRTAIALTALTGFTGLVYQVTWQQSLATLLGSHSEATAAVLGIFLGGLSGGYWLFGRVTRARMAGAAGGRPPRLLPLYGAVEAGIGAWALLFYPLLRGLERVSLGLAPEAAGAGFAFDVGLTALLILPPTLGMGATIPMLTQALAPGLEGATRVHAWIYGVNTAGAFLGALVAGFVLIPWLGIPVTLAVMGSVNLAVGGGYVLLGARAPAPPLPGFAPVAPTPAVRGGGVFAAAALLLGFAMMSLQTTVIRVGGLALGASPFTFAMVVAAFVLCLALGSLAVSALPTVGPRHLLFCVWGLAGLLLLFYLALPDAPYWAHVLRIEFGRSDRDFYLFSLTALAALVAVFAVPLGLSGASLPLLFHVQRREVGALGDVAGRLYSCNTVGNLLGALLCGYALLFWLDLDQIYRLAVASAALAAALLTTRLRGWSPARAGALLVAPLLLALALLPRWDPKQLASGLFYLREATPLSHAGPSRFFAGLKRRTVFYRDGPVASVAVREIYGPAGVDRMIVTNGTNDSTVVHDGQTNQLLGLLPCLLAQRCERALVIGYGIGITAGTLASLDSVREVVVAEIEPAVIQAAPWFDYANENASRNPKIRFVRGDAYRTLLRSHERFDVIASEPSVPWVAGVEMLYSAEFLQVVKDHLAPGGVFGQWMHQYDEMDDATFGLIVETHARVFPHSALWYAGHPTDVELLGVNGPEIDVERVAARAGETDVAAALARAGVESVPALLVHEAMPLDVPAALHLSGRVHTLFHPLLGHSASLAFFRGRGSHLPSSASGPAARLGARNALLRRYEALRGGELTDADREQAIAEASRRGQLVEACALLAEWLRQEPASPRLERAIAGARAELPLGLRRRLTRPLLERLAGLYGPAPASDGSPRHAAGALRLYRRFYWPGAPFALPPPRQADSLRSAARRAG